MKKNGFSPLLIILIILVWVGLGYFVYKNYSLLFPQKVAVTVTPTQSLNADGTDATAITGDQSKWMRLQKTSSCLENLHG